MSFAFSDPNLFDAMREVERKYAAVLRDTQEAYAAAFAQQYPTDVRRGETIRMATQQRFVPMKNVAPAANCAACGDLDCGDRVIDVDVIRSMGEEDAGAGTMTMMLEQEIEIPVVDTLEQLGQVFDDVRVKAHANVEALVCAAAGKYGLGLVNW